MMKNLLLGNLPPNDPVLDFVLLNSAALIYVDGKAESLEEAVGVARESISSGRAWKALRGFVEASRRDQ